MHLLKRWKNYIQKFSTLIDLWNIAGDKKSCDFMIWTGI